MYLDHFNLKTKPFALSTDPRFLWAGANQRQALATLSYGLQENRGIVVLSGEFGTGKTTLLNAFVQSLEYTVRVAQLPEPGTDLTHFRRMMAEGFGIRTESPDLEALMEALARLADDQRDYQGRLLLVIDEAQGLTTEMQADLLRLACREFRDRKLLHILLVGQDDIYQWTTGTPNHALIQQVSATCRLHPLNENETAAYIDLRLRVGGAVRPLFDEAAVTAIHSFSQGMPRAINLMCDFALLQAHLKGADKVDAELVGTCKDRFQIAILDNGHTPEVTVRDLATLPAEPPEFHRGGFRGRLGLAMTVLLVLVAVGFWYYGSFTNPPVIGDKADTVASPAAESPSPLRPSSDPEPSGPPSIPAVAAQKAATLPFEAPRPDPKQKAPLKEQRVPKSGVVDPLVTLPKGDTAEGVLGTSGKQDEARQAAPMKAQRLPTETVAAPRPAAPPAIEEKIPRTTFDQGPGLPRQEAPSVTAEDMPAGFTPGRAVGNTDPQGVVAPVAPASESPTDADPGDIIDWLIQKKRPGGKSQQQVPDETQSASE